MASRADSSLGSLAFRPTTEAARQRLFHQALLGGAGTILALWWTAGSFTDTGFLLGSAICALAMLPAIVWTRTMRYNYPVFEIFIATHLASYGIPMLTEHNAVLLFPRQTRDLAALAVICYLAAACAAFYLTPGARRAAGIWAQPAFQQPDKRWFLRGLVLVTAYTVVIPWFYAPPAGIDGILRAVFFGIGMTCTFIVAVAWGLGGLRRGEKALVVICLAVQFALLSASLVLRAGGSIVLLAVVGYFFGARRVPYLALAIVLPLLAILNIGKYDLRGRYWEDSQKAPLTLGDLPLLYGRWIDAGLHPRAQQDASAGRLLLERNSLMQILCLVVDRTPDPLPYLQGKTYAQIPGQFVPRLLWSDKPRGHVSTYTLSIYYGLQDENATTQTTIAFGFLAEAYANFGLIAVGLFGAVTGFLFRKIAVWSAQAPIFSHAGLILILLTAWSFQTELTLSGWLASLFQAAAAIFVCTFVLRRLQQSRA